MQHRLSEKTGCWEAGDILRDVAICERGPPATIAGMVRYHSQAYAFLVRDVVQRMLLAAIGLAGVRFLVFYWTNTIASLADALNSTVTLIASAVMLYSVWARQPRARRDADEPARGSRIEYMIFGIEGWAILSIGVMVVYHSVRRLFAGQGQTPVLDDLGRGAWTLLAVAAATACVAAWVWIRGRSYQSPPLIAAAKHLIADVFSTLGVALGLLLIRATDLPVLDPIIALLVAGTVLWASWKLLWKSVTGLTDELEREIDPTIRALLDHEVKNSIIVAYDNLRIRFNGPKRWVEVRLLVDPSLTIQAGRELGAMVEGRLRQALGDATVVARVEPKGEQARELAAASEPARPLGTSAE